MSSCELETYGLGEIVKVDGISYIAQSPPIISNSKEKESNNNGIVNNSYKRESH